MIVPQRAWLAASWVGEKLTVAEGAAIRRGNGLLAGPGAPNDNEAVAGAVAL
jgi:hypothetical protein